MYSSAGCVNFTKSLSVRKKMTGLMPILTNSMLSVMMYA